MSRYFVDFSIETTKVFREGAFDKPRVYNDGKRKIANLNNTLLLSDASKIKYAPFDYAFTRDRIGLFDDNSYLYGNKIKYDDKLIAFFEFLFKEMLKTNSCEVVFIFSHDLSVKNMPFGHRHIDMRNTDRKYYELIQIYNQKNNANIKFKGCLFKEYAVMLACQIFFEHFKHNTIFINDYSAVANQNLGYHNTVSNHIWKNEYTDTSMEFFNFKIGKPLPSIYDFDLENDFYQIPLATNVRLDVKKKAYNNYSLKCEVIGEDIVDIIGLVIVPLRIGQTVLKVYYDENPDYCKYVYIQVLEQGFPLMASSMRIVELDLNEEYKLDIDNNIFPNYYLKCSNDNIIERDGKIIAKHAGNTLVILKKLKYHYFDDLKEDKFIEKMKLMQLDLSKENNYHLINYINEIMYNENKTVISLTTQDEQIDVDCTNVMNLNIERLSRQIASLAKNLIKGKKNNQKYTTICMFSSKHLEEGVKKILVDEYYEPLKDKKIYKELNNFIYAYMNYIIDYNKVDNPFADESLIIKKNIDKINSLPKNKIVTDGVRIYNILDFIEQGEILKIARKFKLL